MTHTHRYTQSAVFIELLPTKHPLRKIFNRNTVKISFKFMPNMAQAVSRQDQAQVEPVRQCNCARGVTCQLFIEVL